MARSAYIKARAFGGRCVVLALYTVVSLCPGLLVPRIAAAAAHPIFAVLTPRADQFLRNNRVGRIIASVMINGRGPFQFMLDTGSSRAVLSAALVKRLGLALDSDARVSVRGVTGVIVAPTAYVNRLDSGAMHARDLRLPVLSGPLLEGIDGILGMDGFEGKRLTADFIRRRLSIADSPATLSWLPFPAAHVKLAPAQQLSPQWLMVEGYVGDVYTRAIIDTGGAHTLGNLALLRALESERGEALPQVETTVEDATQLLHSGGIARVPSLRLGSADINNLAVTFADFQVFEAWGLADEPALLIGMDVLGSMSELSIDYRLREMQFLPRPYVRAASN
jgi:hypothetical protein